MPSIKQGLDDFYGKQTVLNALNLALNQGQTLPVDGCCSEVSNKEIDKTYGHKSFIEGGLTGDKLLKK